MKGLFVAALILVFGCGMAAVEPEPHLCDQAKALRSSPAFLSVPEEAAIAAQVLPGGFGGLFQNLGPVSDGHLVAYFKEDGGQEMKKQLSNLLRCGAIYPGWVGTLVVTDPNSIIIRPGQYTAIELLSFRNVLDPLKTDSAVWGLEIDPETNRVWLGITRSSELARIQGAVLGRGVPLEAVQIEAPPPTIGYAQYEVVDPAVSTRGGEVFGTISFAIRVRFTNRQGSTRYPDWCVGSEWTSMLIPGLEKWTGSEWKPANGVTCIAILVPPRAVEPGQSVTDSVLISGARRLNTAPAWMTARITGTYRLVGRVFRSTVPNPLGGTPFLADLAPPEEQISPPFRITNTLPF